MSADYNEYNLTIIEHQESTEALLLATGLTAYVAAWHSGAGSAMRLASVLTLCVPNEHWGSRERFNIVMSPTQLVVHDYILGAVVGNFALFVGLVLLNYAASAMFARKRWRQWCGFPALTFVAFQLLHPGTVLASLELVVEHYGEGMWTFMLGWIGFALCATFPYVINLVARRHSTRATVVPLPSSTPVVDWFVGSRCWVEKARGQHWLEGNWPVVAPYTQHTAWFIGVEYAAGFFLSTTQALEPTSVEGCGHVKVAAACIFMLCFIAEVAVSPYLARRNNVLSAATTLLCCSAMAFVARGHYKPAEVDLCFDVADVLLTCALVITTVRTALDVVAWVLLCVHSPRYAGVQEAQFVRDERERARANKWTDLIDKVRAMSDAPPPQERPLKSALKPKAVDTSGESDTARVATGDRSSLSDASAESLGTTGHVDSNLQLIVSPRPGDLTRCIPRAASQALSGPSMGMTTSRQLIARTDTFGPREKTSPVSRGARGGPLSPPRRSPSVRSLSRPCDSPTPGEALFRAPSACVASDLPLVIRPAPVHPKETPNTPTVPLVGGLRAASRQRFSGIRLISRNAVVSPEN